IINVLSCAMLKSTSKIQIHFPKHISPFSTFLHKKRTLVLHLPNLV
ncbi:Inactive pancreatic lipase-related protein 1, partial [Araneus ventricosus]